MSFLEEVLATKKTEIEDLRRKPPAKGSRVRSTFREAVAHPGLCIIAEIKRRSPSKGVIVPDLDSKALAAAYAEGGAVAISCLTDTKFFGALPDDFANARQAGLPVLRKDFLIEEIQIDESVAIGASAVLLIARILEGPRLEALIKYASSCGLDTLVEVHEEAEIDRAVAAGANLIGVNNRNLATLEVDPERAVRLRPKIPAGVVCVAESGVKSKEQVQSIREADYDAMLIGETLVRAKDPAATLRSLLDFGPESSL